MAKAEPDNGNAVERSKLTIIQNMRVIFETEFQNLNVCVYSEERPSSQILLFEHFDCFIMI